MLLNVKFTSRLCEISRCVICYNLHSTHILSLPFTSSGWRDIAAQLPSVRTLWEAYLWDFVGGIPLRPLDGFVPFDTLHNYLDLMLCNAMVICLISAGPLGQNPVEGEVQTSGCSRMRSRLDGTLITETAWQICFIQSSTELSRPVILQCHYIWPICPNHDYPWAKYISQITGGSKPVTVSNLWAS